MKYILVQNTSYTRRPLFFIEPLEEWKRSKLSEASHNKPILISTSKPILNLLKETLMEKYTK